MCRSRKPRSSRTQRALLRPSSVAEFPHRHGLNWLLLNEISRSAGQSGSRRRDFAGIIVLRRTQTMTRLAMLRALQSAVNHIERLVAENVMQEQ